MLYPVNLNIAGILCLVIGGGTVAGRKINSLLPCGAEVRVISPEVCDYIATLVGRGLVEWRNREYREGDLQGAKLVFAATDLPQVQKQIVAEAVAADIPVNVVDMPEACTFQVPASIRQGQLLVTVATGGGSPALAARIRRDLEKSYGPEYAHLVAMMTDIRKEIVSSSDDSAEHKKIFEKLLEKDILNYIRECQWERLRELLQAILPAGIDVSGVVGRIQDQNEQ